MGFPNRHSRSAFGPHELEDTWPVTDERKAASAATFMLAWWQLAGVNLTAARGLVSVKRDGTSVTTQYQGLSWDADSALADLVWTRTSAGIYTYSFPSAVYPDENGVDIPLVLIGADVDPQAKSAAGNVLIGQHELLGPRNGRVTLWDVVASAAADIEDLKTFLVRFY